MLCAMAESGGRKGTNWKRRTSMSVRFGTIALTSRMILGFAPASNASSLTLKTVFSFGFSCSPHEFNYLTVYPQDGRRTTSGSSAAATGAAAGAAEGMAISWMFNRDW